MVPEIVRIELIGPPSLPVVGIAREQRCCPEIVSGPLVRVPRAGIRCPVIESIEVGIVGEPTPHGAAADLPCVGRPGGHTEIRPFHEIIEWLEIRADPHVSVGTGRIGDVGDLARSLVERGDASADPHFTPADADEHLALHNEGRGGRGLAEIDVAGLGVPLLLARLRVERDDVVVERHQKDLSVVVRDAASENVAAGDALRRAVLIGNVGPLQIPRYRIQSEHLVGKRADYVQRVANNQRRSFLPPLRANRKHPRDLELRDVRLADLIERD